MPSSREGPRRSRENVRTPHLWSLQSSLTHTCASQLHCCRRLPQELRRSRHDRTSHTFRFADNPPTAANTDSRFLPSTLLECRSKSLPSPMQSSCRTCITSVRHRPRSAWPRPRRAPSSPTTAISSSTRRSRGRCSLIRTRCAARAFP